MSDAKPETPTPKKSKKKLVIALAAGLVLAAGGAGAAWYVTGKNGGHEAAPAKKEAKKPLFITLEPFTVNLRDPRGERFAQIGVTLQFEDPEVEINVKDRLPAVRNGILLLISSKEIDDLLTPEGKQQLAQEIRNESGRALGVDIPAAPAAAASAAASAVAHAVPVAPAAPAARNPIQAVLFSQFIVQ